MTHKFSSETVGIHTRLDDIDAVLGDLMDKAKQNEAMLQQLLKRIEAMDSAMDDKQASAVNRLNVS